MGRIRALFGIAMACAVAACAANSGLSMLPGGTSASSRQAAGAGPTIDLGRRNGRERVRVVVVLRYNHQTELDRLVDSLARGSRAYLTQAQFETRFAPTTQQETQVLRALRAAGFSIDRTYRNRLVVDASAPSAAVERFFGTRMHDFRQGRYGVRYANVTPLRVPAAIAPLVSAVLANRLVLRRAGTEMLIPPVLLPPAQPPVSDAVPTKNVIHNPGFETGHLRPWTGCRSSSQLIEPVIAKIHPHSGKFDAYAGTLKDQAEPNGTVAVCQLVTIPAGGSLSAFTWGVSNDKSKRVEQFAVLFDPISGKPVKTFFTANVNSKHWVARGPYNVSALAGKEEYVAFGIVGSSRDKDKIIGQYVDDVSLTSVTSPSPSPSSPSSSPPSSPGPSPSPVQSAMPCPAVSPTPTPNTAPNGGWGPASVADGFCMPSNYGYNGAGETAAIVIDATVNATDLSGYLSNYGIVQSGTVSYEAVDNATLTNDTEGEATLDLETIAGLAPGANIIVYVVPGLDDQSIADAYTLAVNDAKAGVINSSFGGCEAGDQQFGQATDQIAEGAAATGVTFSASSGDQGSDCYAGGGSASAVYDYGVNAPASGPHFVGVGGTQSTAAAAAGSGCFVPGTPIANPVVWNDCVGSGGGGLSTLWPAPSWQSGIAGASRAHRNVPDIALPAAYDGICYHGCTGLFGSWTMIWGTSWASPIYVAMQTEINEACGRTWGLSTIYGGFAKSGYAVFQDVTSGNNQWQGGGNPNPLKYYSAANGFDNVSGIGMPVGALLAQSQCGLPASPRRK